MDEVTITKVAGPITLEPSEDRTLDENLAVDQAAQAVPEATVDPDESRKARQAGEEKRLAVQALIEAAKSSDTAKEQLFKSFEKQPSLKSYVEKKFGDDLKVLTGDIATNSEAKSAEQLKMEARVEIFTEIERKEKEEMVVSLCEKLGKSRADAERVHKAAEIYAQNTGSDFKEALTKMARAEWPEHMSVLTLPSNSTSIPSGDVVIVTDGDRALAKQLGQKPEYIAKHRAKLEKGEALTL